MEEYYPLETLKKNVLIPKKLEEKCTTNKHNKKKKKTDKKILKNTKKKKSLPCTNPMEKLDNVMKGNINSN